MYPRMEPAKWQAQAEMLINRVKKNRRRLRSWARAEKVTCYRIYDRDIPELPLIVDWYDGRLHVSLLRRYDDGEVGPEWTEVLADRLSVGLGVGRRDIFVKHRAKGRGGTQYAPLDNAGRLVEVGENGLLFLLNLTDYLDTGLFLDHRLTRRMVRDEARGKRFLNLFAYTGSFSVYAAAGGAVSTTSVDLSNTYLDWAQKNMRANGFDTDDHHFIRDDILSALENRRVEGCYDLVVIDPPTVSKSKAMERAFDIQRDHVILLNRIRERISSGGVVYFSCNFKRFKLREDELKYSEVTDITEKTIPPDFRDRSVHKCFRMVR